MKLHPTHWLNPAYWPINEDVDREFRFWMTELQKSVACGGVLAVATGVLIAVLARGSAQPGARFAWDFWPYLVEIAFWSGMLAGLLRAAGQRIGMALAATLPWQQPQDDRESTGRFFGQWSGFAALLGFFLWLAYRLALAANTTGLAAVLTPLLPLETVCWITAGLFAAIALGHRRHAPASERPLPQ